MKRVTTLLAFCFILLALVGAGSSEIGMAQGDDKLVYADFESVKDNYPVTNRGGALRLFGYQQSPSSPSTFKGGPVAPDVPELVRLSKDNPNRALAFKYQFQPPNQWAGVGVQVHGHEEKEGKIIADDVSGFKYLTVQLYVTGVTTVSAEFVSRGQGIKMDSGFPALIFKVKPGFNTYKVPLNSVSQPSWAEIKVSTKDLLKKLTSINFVVSCAQCTPLNGDVVIDNVIFEK
jgi:hypothetical protein